MKLLTCLNRIEDSRPYRFFRQRVNRRLVNFLERFLAGPTSGSGLAVLEAACGSGYGAHLLAGKERIRLSVGMDNDLRLFKSGGIKASSARLVIGDIYHPPFSPGSFDLVWNSSSVEEVADPAAAIRSMAALAKSGGYVYVGVPNILGPMGLCHLLPHSGWRKWLGKPYRGAQLDILLTACGLTVEAGVTYLAGCLIGRLARKR